MAASMSERIVNTADSAANCSSGDNPLKSKPMEYLRVRNGKDYDRFATRARYTHEGWIGTNCCSPGGIWHMMEESA